MSALSIDAASAVSRPCISYLELGASLYMPALREDLQELMNGLKQPRLRSLVVCTEDAVPRRLLRRALANLRSVLPALDGVGPLRLVRPRDPEVLQTILAMSGVDNLDGICLPKLDERNIEDYLQVLSAAPTLPIMPIIETDVAFSPARLERLRERLDDVKERILCVRIGGNDLLQLLGMKRPKDLTAYDTPLRRIIDDLIIAFRVHGYELSAPVYEHLDRPQVLAREVELDIAHGLIAKTAIHPTQVRTIEAGYAVTPEEAAMARAVLDPKAAGVFRLDGQMVEPATHARWAERTLARLAAYGLGDTSRHPTGW